jgi:Na+/H+ antiporter NhaD/arsenite permease-like protein
MRSARDVRSVGVASVGPASVRAAAVGAIVTAGLLVSLPAQAAAATTAALGRTLPLATVAPFVLLLLAIAVLPLVAGHWWERNGNKALVALLLGVPTACYIGLKDYHVVLHALHEYASFIALLGALYVISGGLLLEGDIVARPAVNLSFLAIGAVLANVIGTTGAAMLLIRPLLRTNAAREHVWHIPVFFIFVVANIGGLLTPLGDPPLFLGYLRGVPFAWTLRLLPIWALAVGCVLLVFYLWDRRAYAREPAAALARDEREQVPLRLRGQGNLGLLVLVIASVFFPAPWRELSLVALALVSLRFTPRALRLANGFTLQPIIEVAVLFAGIFLAMVPALEILRARGGELGLSQPWQFFWVTGALSSVLDNAPTYVSFLSLAQGLGLRAEVVGVPHLLLEAIAAGAVLMGANSYIGNGPNFMVRAIAEQSGVRMPHFFGYMLLAALVLWPIFGLVTLVFFR